MIQMHYYFTRPYLTDDIEENRSKIFEYAYFIPSLNKIVVSIPKNGSSTLQALVRYARVGGEHELYLIQSDDEAWHNPENEIIYFLRHPLDRFRSAFQWEYEQFSRNFQGYTEKTYLEVLEKYYLPLSTTNNMHYWPQSLFLPYDEEELERHFSKSQGKLMKDGEIVWAKVNGGYNEMLKKLTPRTDSRIKYYHLSKLSGIILPILQELNPGYSKTSLSKVNQSYPHPFVDDWVDKNMADIASIYSEDINIYERLTFSSN